MVEIKNVSKVFDNGVERNVALQDTSLEIADGEFVTIIGGNGAGKSTLFNLINGNLKPSGGQIIIDGVDVTRKSKHKRAGLIACVFQDPSSGVCPDMTVAENLAIAFSRGKCRGLGRAVRKKQLELFKERLSEYDLGLELCLKRPMSLLSGGQRQVVTLLMATLQRPKLLLLDEHTSALDPKIAKQVMEITNRLVGDGNITTIMITHNLGCAVKYGSRLLMLDGGRVTVDVRGADKKKMTVAKLMRLFEQ